ncbi:acyltransferase [Microbulbifer sp. ALW1]|uniref:acyltransferase family protein n=1 Tax=Microbulbifer sp. (strain ALW1) TaxID=1516059 RepID=UPI0013594991|nr:acyltransferase [Microbulbifer sp. ALW1]
MFLNSFNYFRAVAITLIVAGHFAVVSNLNLDGIAAQVFYNLVVGGTALFVFISGFMFHHVFYVKFLYSKFLIGKLKNVAVPYLILGVTPILYYVVNMKSSFGDFYLPEGGGLFNEYVVPALKYYGTGRFLTAYWYVPFILVMFVLAPLHVLFVRLKFKWQVILTVCLASVALFVHRPVANISVLHSVIYYTPIYLFGIICSIYRDSVYSFWRGKEFFLFFGAICISFIQVHTGHLGNYHKDFFEFAGLDLIFLQKILLCLFFMVWLSRYEAFNSKVLNLVAGASFSIFFLHPFMLVGFGKLGISSYLNDSWGIYFVVVLVVILVCIAVSYSVKKMFPRYSRYLIGY